MNLNGGLRKYTMSAVEQFGMFWHTVLGVIFNLFLWCSPVNTLLSQSEDHRIEADRGCQFMKKTYPVSRNARHIAGWWKHLRPDDKALDQIGVRIGRANMKFVTGGGF